MSSYLNKQTLFFPLRLPNGSKFQLDIAGFLAILGEGSVLANAQVASLSPIMFLPRLLPAPQALMMPSRPSKLEPAIGYTTGVESGNHRDYINYIGHVLVDAEFLPGYSVRCVEIRRKYKKGEVKAKVLGPLWILAILGFMESIILFTLSVLSRDHAALIATISLSLLSSLIGFGNKWTLNLPKRRHPGIITPPGNVVIRYPNGNFLVVQCHEDVARELYFAPEDMKYLITHSWKYRMISLVGTFLLMVGIICLSNASTLLQIGFAASYMILNVAYWVVAALPAETHWDTSCFEVLDQCFEEKNAENVEIIDKVRSGNFVECNKTFTQALWKVIVVTKNIKWVQASQAAPQTPAWAEWLRKAKKWARTKGFRDEKIGDRVVRVWEVPDWDAQAALSEVIQEYTYRVDSESN